MQETIADNSVNDDSQEEIEMSQTDCSIIEEIDSKPTSTHKRKLRSSAGDKDEILRKACAIMNKSEDEFDAFGAFVANELREMRHDFLRRKLKRTIQKAILDIGEEDDLFHFPPVNSAAGQPSFLAMLSTNDEIEKLHDIE